MKDFKDKKAEKTREYSGFSIACKSFHAPVKIKDETSYSLIRYIGLSKVDEIKVGNIEILELLSKELSDYVRKVKEGGTV